jgi:hypothetical protein
MAGLELAQAVPLEPKAAVPHVLVRASQGADVVGTVGEAGGDVELEPAGVSAGALSR